MLLNAIIVEIICKFLQYSRIYKYFKCEARKNLTLRDLTKQF